MNRIFDCWMSDRTLDKIAEVFVPTREVYYVHDDGVVGACLQQGIPVYTRQEFASTFPLFALDYGSVYHQWTMKLQAETSVLMVQRSELWKLPGEFQKKLLVQQIYLGRGHIYDSHWLTHFNVHLPCSIVVQDQSYAFLSWDDWWALSPDTRRQWVLEWLREWRKEDAEGVSLQALARHHDGVPYELIQEYAGRFGPASTANCFAAAIAMAVGSGNPKQARVLINEWLHQEPFSRLLAGQGYTKHTEFRHVRDLIFRPADILVWHTGEGVAGHAGYAVTDRLIFQKQGQGWDNPWQVLKVDEVWYNNYLTMGGYIVVYRRASMQQR